MTSQDNSFISLGFNFLSTGGCVVAPLRVIVFSDYSSKRRQSPVESCLYLPRVILLLLVVSSGVIFFG